MALQLYSSPQSMIALERPFISQLDTGGAPEFILEYGSASYLYTVPFIHNEEQVHINLITNFIRGCNLEV